MHQRGQHEFEELKAEVFGPRGMKSMMYQLHKMLKFVVDYPEYKDDVGLLWHDHNTFLINTRVFSIFTKRKPNSVNRNFRDHQFMVQKSSHSVLRRHGITDNPRCWMLRWNMDFNIKTGEEDLKNIKFKISEVSKLSCSTTDTNEDNSPNEFNLDLSLENYDQDASYVSDFFDIEFEFDSIIE